MRRLVAVAAVLAVGPAASAHPQFQSTGTSRYIKVSLLGGGALRIAYTLMVGEVPAAAARALVDANHDGNLSDAEQAAAARALEGEVDKGLVVEVDGTRRAVAWETPVPGFSSDTRVGPIPYSIDLVGRVEAGTGQHRLRLDDTTPIANLAETEIRVEEGPRTRLLGGWRGREDGGLQSRFVFNGPKFSMLEDRSVGFKYVDEGEAKKKSRRPLPIAPLAAMLSALIAGIVAVRYRRKRTASRS